MDRFSIATVDHFSIDIYIRYEMTKTLTEKTLLVKCENCGFYFVPQGKSDSKYCSRIKGNAEKPCSEIGAYRKYKKSITDERKYYISITKHYYYLVKNKQISKSDYCIWSEYAQSLYKKYKKKDITFQALKKWLDLDFDKAVKMQK